MIEIQKEALELFRRKNADYGDAFATYGAIGVLVRIGDKIKRLMSISSNQICMVNDESMYDTLLDLHNYAAMALMLMKDPPVHPEKEEDPDAAGNWCGDGVDLWAEQSYIYWINHLKIISFTVKLKNSTKKKIEYVTRIYY